MPPRSQDFVYYVGGRTALGIRRAEPAQAGIAHVEAAPGIDHLCFRARSREDVDAVHALLLRIGADIVRPPRGGPVGAGLLLAVVPRPRGHPPRGQPRPRARACWRRARRSSRPRTTRCRGARTPADRPGGRDRSRAAAIRHPQPRPIPGHESSRPPGLGHPRTRVIRSRVWPWGSMRPADKFDRRCIIGHTLVRDCVSDHGRFGWSLVSETAAAEGTRSGG